MKITKGSGNVFADIGCRNPDVLLRLAGECKTADEFRKRARVLSYQEGVRD